MKGFLFPHSLKIILQNTMLRKISTFGTFFGALALFTFVMQILTGIFSNDVLQA